ncbi:hypothetical protein EVAR_103151_1 [Eumeta japonica]|uniref:Uncharacterized protein n=1 Tax=Eumeta variegata TaxID=151549 RepID=A0A4C1YHV4_EUMVA|nr:hypothetical protein EVAR_103151_1 [Eumeta japonica]
MDPTRVGIEGLLCRGDPLWNSPERMSRAADTPAGRPAAFGEAIIEIQLYSIADSHSINRGKFLSDLQASAEVEPEEGVPTTLHRRYRARIVLLSIQTAIIKKFVCMYVRTCVRQPLETAEPRQPL